MSVSTTAAFYQLTLNCQLVWQFGVLLLTGQPLYKKTCSSVITKPSWLSVSSIMFLHNHRQTIFTLQIILLGFVVLCLRISGTVTIPSVIQLLAASTFAIYHLVETAMTSRHGEYPIMYALWALYFFNDEYVDGALLGIAVNFVFAAGLSKLSIGGIKWVSPVTMSTYFSVYRNSNSFLTRPLMPNLNKYMARHDEYMTGVSIFTLVLECVVVPGSLFMPSHWRPIVAAIMVLMHVGIAVTMSLQVGLVFLSTFPIYIMGFQSDGVEPWTGQNIGPWITALIIGLLPFFLLVIQFLQHQLFHQNCFPNMILPEDWPLSAISLFMWSGESAGIMHRLLMTLDTRMVFATSATLSAGDIVGRKVIQHDNSTWAWNQCFQVANSIQKDPVVHCCRMRSIGFTQLKGGNSLLKTFFMLQDNQACNSKTEDFVKQTENWLQSEKRLLEAHTGHFLSFAFMVRIDSNMRVVEVLLRGSK
mmetsp:Transcript_6385/g.13381  ORF Transcript_6385/g.13381 Transcript_6385/m.13381 type:complete len:473 (-) Transcript_6385:36-1454(-)